jgi:hypothetical protein
MDARAREIEIEVGAGLDEVQRLRLQRGLRQVSDFWQPEDGDADALEALVRTHFVADQGALDTLFTRVQRLLEQLDGHMMDT